MCSGQTENGAPSRSMLGLWKPEDCSRVVACHCLLVCMMWDMGRGSGSPRPSEDGAVGELVMAGVGETNHCFPFISESSAHMSWKPVDSWLGSVLPICQMGPED